MSAVVPGVDVASAEAVGPNTVNDSEPSPDCGRMQGPRGCPGPRGPAGVPGAQGPQGSAGPQPPLSDAVNSDARDIAASSLAVKTVHTSMRVPCVTPLTLHVRLDGDDANDGLSESRAKRTLLGALSELPRYDARDTVTTIRIGPGRFNIGLFNLSRVSLHGHPRLDIRGAGQSETTLYHGEDQYLFQVYSTDVRLYDMTLRGELYVSEHALLALVNVTLEAARSNATLIWTQRMALTAVSNTLTVRGDCNALFLTQRNGCLHFGSSGILTLQDTPRYSVAVANAAGGTIFWEGTSQGTCTGLKYRESWGGRVLTGGDPNLVIPGSVNGA